jgi:hypothetical protein
MINELRLDDIGTERRLQIMEQTFDSRRKWVVNCRPMFTEFFNKFPTIKDMGVLVSINFGFVKPVILLNFYSFSRSQIKNVSFAYLFQVIEF